jgi:RimJ/RimL family protein N-acetyltransferase
MRPWQDDDLGPLHRAMVEAADHLRPWMAWATDEPIGPDERRAVFDRFRQDRESDVSAAFAMLHGTRIVGGFGIHRRVGPGAVEIGYWLHPAHTGQGLASEAAATATGLLLDRHDIGRVEIHHDRANTRSRGVPVRLGFRFVGEFTEPDAAPAAEGIECRWAAETGWRPPGH